MKRFNMRKKPNTKNKKLCFELHPHASISTKINNTVRVGASETRTTA